MTTDITDTTPTPPATMEDIKRLAKRIKRQDGLTYSYALDRASRKYGFNDFPHARRELKDKS